MKLLFVFLSILSVSVHAGTGVTCSGIPTAVHSGLVGPSPYGSTYFVTVPNGGVVPIGPVQDDLAKSRFSLALTAYTAGKAIVLRYYYHDDCAKAYADTAVPNQVSISD